MLLPVYSWATIPYVFFVIDAHVLCVLFWKRDPLLRDVSHVILDEVHERDLNSDLLLVVLRNLLRKRSDLKLVLMSATLNAEMFASYFMQSSDAGPPMGVPMLHIPGFTFPVQEFFLEDALEWTQYDISQDIRESGNAGNRPRGRGRGRGRGGRRWGQRNTIGGSAVAALTDDGVDVVADHRVALEARELSQKAVEGTLAFVEHALGVSMVQAKSDSIPYGLVAELVRKLDVDDPLSRATQGSSTSKTPQTGGQAVQPGGSVLVFLPGHNEIVKLCDRLRGNPRLLVLPLHGSMATRDQRHIFAPAPAGKRKIVVATNIAESSITIEDISYVANIFPPVLASQSKHLD